jgi:outer membrane receptor protein involved in Fe transport
MRFFASLLLLCACMAPYASAQIPQGDYSISGTVSDPSGAGIPDADVQVRPRGATTATAKTRTDSLGNFRASGLPAGSFEIDVRRDGFAGQTLRVTIKELSPAPLRVDLKLAGVRQEVTVSDSAAQVSTESADNLDVVTMDRQMMDNLPVFDQNYVAAMSQFLDPGSIGTGGVTLVVNGMEQRNIGVSVSAIQQVKINQNPYSAEFSRPGRGRIEVITKPASQVYHGTFNFLFRDYQLNARDPFAATRPPEQRRIYEGSLAGPVGHSKKNSFLISVDREEQDLQAVVYAITPNGLVQQTAANPLRDTEISASITHQFTEDHLATIRGSFHDSTEQNHGVGGFVLPEAGVNVQDREDELYYNDSLVISPALLNQFRIVIGRDHAPTSSVSQAPGIVVPGSFTGGGAQGDLLHTENHTNINEIVTWTHGKHNIRGGINVPDISRRGLDDNTNIGGTYYFSTLQDYLLARPYSFIQQQGDGHIIFVETVVGGFAQDDYRLRPNLTLSAGLRYDWQNYFHDNNNVSPRLSLAYSPGKSRKTVLRAGGGIFYDRTGNGPIFDLERYNGVRLRQIVLSDPTYPVIPGAGGLAAMPSTLVRLDPTERIPYLGEFSAALERQLRSGTTLSVTYWASRGVSLFRSRDVNAPPPPDYLVRPNPAIGIYRQIESSGHMESNAMEVSFRGHITRFFQGMVQYTLGESYNDVPGNYSVSTRSVGINAFPANNYDLSGEWARADYDARHRLNLMGTIHAAKYLDFGIGFFVNSGMPYTETTGLDEYHTGYANARPPGVSRNSLQGPGFAELDMRWSHAFLLKHKKEGPQFTVGLDAFNLTNRVNYVSYVGDLSSPFFGQPVAAKPPRRLQLSGRFEF